jgi:hypothetical protein
MSWMSLRAEAEALDIVGYVFRGVNQVSLLRGSIINFLYMFPRLPPWATLCRASGTQNVFLHHRLCRPSKCWYTAGSAAPLALKNISYRTDSELILFDAKFCLTQKDHEAVLIAPSSVHVGTL